MTHTLARLRPEHITPLDDLVTQLKARVVPLLPTQAEIVKRVDTMQRAMQGQHTYHAEIADDVGLPPCPAVDHLMAIVPLPGTPETPNNPGTPVISWSFLEHLEDVSSDVIDTTFTERLALVIRNTLHYIVHDHLHRKSRVVYIPPRNTCIVLAIDMDSGIVNIECHTWAE